MDIPGNEAADTAAKDAANSKGELGLPFEYAIMKSARNMTIKASSKSEWTKGWQEGKETATQLRGISKRPMVESGIKLYGIISTRQEAAWIIRLRTGHCSLNQYLHRFNIKDNPKCACGDAIETVTHYLLRCGNYDEEREKLRKEVGMGSMRVEKLLGYPKLINHTLEYIKNTKRFTF